MGANLLQGQKIRLAAVNPEEMAKCFNRWNLDTEYYRLLDSEPPFPWSEKKFKEWLEKDLEKEDKNSYFFSIKPMDEDRVIGFIALFDEHWHHGDTLVGIAIGEREYWGRSYGTDAMQTLLRYAFQELNLRRVGLIVFEYNDRAIRSYEKSGFVLEGRIRGAMRRDGRRWDWLMMGVLRQEWENKFGEVI